MLKINPIDLQAALRGVDHPAHKQALLEAAETTGAPPEVRDALEGLPDQQYETPADVSRAVSFD
jgi:hypothetical protein